MLLGGCGDGDSIRVALVLPLSGPLSEFGESARDGALMAFDEINAAGGIRGQQLELFLADDRNDPSVTVMTAERLADDESVVALIGSISTACSEPLAAWCETAGLPMISPSSTSPFVTINRDGTAREYAFRACFTDSFQGAVAARFAREEINAVNAAVMYNEDDEYSSGLARFFIADFEALGGTVVGIQTYDTGMTDYEDQVKRLQSVRPDLVFLPDYYNRVGIIAREAWQAGLRSQLLGGDGWDSPDMLALAGDAIRGGYFTSHFAPDDPRPEVRDWAVRYRSRYGYEPNALAALGYDAVMLLADALERAETIDRNSIRNTLARTDGFPGVTGVISFNEFGNPVKPAVIRQFDADGPRYLLTIGEGN